MQEPDFSVVERLIDAGGLEHLLDTIAAICHEKAEHIRSNWQDEITAKSWDRDARKIETISSKIEN